MSNLLLKSVDYARKTQVIEAVIVWGDGSMQPMNLPAVDYLKPYPEISISRKKADDLFHLSGMKENKDRYLIINDFRARSLSLARWFADAVLDQDQLQLGKLADHYAPIARDPRGPALAVPFLQGGSTGLLFFGATR